ncbi:MAG: tetratricopeptide repeat protein [Kiritimatiellia bacterium]
MAGFAIACRLATPELTAYPESGLFRLLGGTRMAFGDELFLKADQAFHKGVGPSRPRAFRDWFAVVREQMVPRGHAHLDDDAMQDIMPWLYLSTRVNPTNVNAYVTAAYWMTTRLERPDLAELMLREAQRHNPRDYRIQLEQGRRAIKSGEWGTAGRYLDAGLRRWPHPLDQDDPEARIDLAQILMYRGLLYEMEGALDPAQSAYAAILDMFPERDGVRERMGALREHGSAPMSPEYILQNLLLHSRHVCEHDDEHPH